MLEVVFCPVPEEVKHDDGHCCQHYQSCLTTIILSLSSPLLSFHISRLLLQKIKGRKFWPVTMSSQLKTTIQAGSEFISSRVLYLETSWSSSYKPRNFLVSSWWNVEIILRFFCSSHLLSCFLLKNHLTIFKRVLRVWSMSKTVHNFLQVVRKKVI